MDERLLVFVRWPEPGRAKTRLIPRLGPEGAAAVYRRVAEYVCGSVAQLDRPSLRRIACVEPAARLDDVGLWLGSRFAVAPQGEGDLGARLARAFDEAFLQGARRVVVIGTDCPDVDAALVAEAFDALATHDAVFGPAHDGGYYLLGLSRSMPRAFAHVPWSTADTGATTLARLAEEGARVALLPVLRDLDEPPDYDVLVERFPDLLRG